MRRAPERRPPRFGRRPVWALALAVAAVIVWFGVRHGADFRHGRFGNLQFIATAAFCWLVFSLAAAWSHRDQPSTPETRLALADLRVTAIVAVYNEDPAMFAAMLDSLGAQQRLPSRLHVVDDGSADTACRDEFDFWYRHRRPHALEAEYSWQPNSGKRHAQARAVRADPAADVYVTIDSDVLLANPDTMGILLAPFARRRTMSVAGFLLGANRRRGLLYRLVELGFVTSFLTGRTTYSALKSVTVNAGGLAAYRGEVLIDNLPHYLRQTVLGRHVMSGDDAMLTRYALLRGHCVFQRNAVGLTLHPESMRHLVRQRIRWWRSYFWGNAWFVSNFPARRIAWSLIAYDLVTSLWMAAAMPYVLYRAATSGRYALGFLGMIIALSYIGSARFLSVRRPDETLSSQLLTYAMAPLSSLLQIFLGWMLSYVGLFTCAKTGWSTRQTVEVGLDD